MNENLIDVFGKIIKTSRDTGLDVVTNYKNNIHLPKMPDEEQEALLELIKTIDDEQFHQLQKGIKYCVELSIFKLINTLESGINNYKFDLNIHNNNSKTQLIGDDIDNEISSEYWNWIEVK